MALHILGLQNSRPSIRRACDKGCIANSADATRNSANNDTMTKRRAATPQLMRALCERDPPRSTHAVCRFLLLNGQACNSTPFR